MPWTGQSFASRHNHGLNLHQAAHAARIANAVLGRGVGEGEAIAIANKHFQHRDDGGGIVDPTAQGIGGPTPSSQTMNPMTRGMIQRYSSLPPEKLHELAAMMGGSPQGQIIQRVLAQKQAMPTPGQQPDLQPAAPTQSYRRGGQARAPGGGLAMSQAVPGWAQREQSQETSGAGATGFLHGSTPGRADQILTTAPAGAHVIPADVVSGLGEGNSLAGAHVMDQIIHSGPGGIQMPRSGGARSMPRPPPAFHEARGGGVETQTPVALSHGEYVVTPEHVLRWGNGDADAGHKIFDRFIVKTREHIIKTMKKLPGPVKSGKK